MVNHVIVSSSMPLFTDFCSEVNEQAVILLKLILNAPNSFRKDSSIMYSINFPISFACLLSEFVLEKHHIRQMCSFAQRTVGSRRFTGYNHVKYEFMHVNALCLLL